MNKRRSIIARLAAIVAVAITSIWLSLVSLTAKPVFASPSSADIILKKTLLNGIETCYNDTYMKKSIIPADFSGPSSLMETGFFGGGGTKDGVIRVPNNVGNTLSDADISCQQLFNGYSGAGGKISGLFSLFGKSSSANSETQKIKLLENLGYYVEQTAGSTETGCVSISYQTVENSQYTEPISTNQVCFKLTDGNVDVGYSSEGVTYNGDFTSPLYIYYNPADYQLALMSTESVYPINFVALSPYRTPSWSEFTASLGNFVGEYNYPGEYGYGGYHYNVKKADTSSAGGETFSEAVRSSNAARDALHFFSGEPNATFTTYSFVSEDKYALYTAYLNQELQNNSAVIMGSGSECSSSKETAKSSTGYAVRNGAKWCALHGVESGSHYNVIESRLNNKLVDGTFADVINGLMELDYDRLENSGVEIGELEDGEMSGGANTGNTGGNTSAGDSSELAACYDGTGVLGWIVCPVIELVGNATTFLYNEFIEPSLQVQAEKIMSRDEGVYTGWSAFRDYANIAFVIFFAVIILSQLTGIGLSNYNIKKILPRFIMVVVLVNVSFIICQLAIDVSNLLGVGLRSAFTALPLPAGQDRVGAGDIAGSIVSFLGLAVAGGFVVKAVGISALLSSIGFWIVPILISLLGCLISVLFFFIILGARQAGIVILVVLAPLAIVCYALPNTKTFFDRWKKLFTALLLVYPIAGLLMGGGEYAGSLIMSLNKDGDLGFFYTLIGMLITVIPFFLIPNLLKSSMAMMGNLGMKISGLGARVRGGANGAIRRSRMFQESQAEKQRKMNLARDTRTVQRLDRKAARHGGRLSDGAKMRRARAMGNVERALGEYATADALADRELMQRGDDRYSATVQRTKDRSIEESASALTTVWQNNGTSGDYNQLRQVASDAAAKLRTNFNDQSARAKLLAAQKILETSDDGRAALSSMMNEFEASGGSDVEGTNQVLRWMADAAMTRNASTIKRSSPALAAQLNRILKRQSNTDPLSDSADIRSDGRGSYNIKDLGGRIDSLSAGQMPDVDEADLDRFVAAMKNGDIAKGSAEYNRLVTQARKALTDPRISANIKDKVGAKLQQIANMDHTLAARADASTTGGIARAQATAAMAGSSMTDLGRIQEGMKSETISGAERTSMLDTMEQTMRNAMDGHVDLSTENAKKIHEILSENGRSVLSSTASSAEKQKYNALMTELKVNHATPPRGWTESGIWTGGGVGPTKRDEIAYEQWARRQADIDMQNAQNNPPNPPSP